MQTPDVTRTSTTQSPGRAWKRRAWKALAALGAVVLVGAAGVGAYYAAWKWPHRNESVAIEHSALATQYRYGADRTGVAPADATAGPRKRYRLVWVTPRLNVGDYSASKSTPAVTEREVFVATDRGTLVAVRRSDGSRLWEFRGHPSEKGSHSSPAIDDQHVYISDYGGYVYAVRKDTGTMVWESRPGDFIGSSPLLFGDTLLIGVEFRGRRGALVGLERATGREVFRSATLPDLCHSSPAVDAAANAAYMGDNSGGVYRWNLGVLSAAQPQRDVMPAWRFSAQPPSGDVKSTPALWQDLVVATSWDHNVYAIDTASGRRAWRFATGGLSMSSPSIDASRTLVVAGSHDGNVYGLDVNSGKERWRFRAGGPVMSSATLLPHEGVGIIGSSNAMCHVFDLDSGAIHQSLWLYSGLTGVPVAVGRHLYLFDHLGHLYAYTSVDRTR